MFKKISVDILERYDILEVICKKVVIQYIRKCLIIWKKLFYLGYKIRNRQDKLRKKFL